jgi:hypothetical protein
MKHVLFAAILAAVTFSALAADVGVSIRIGQPGFYGQIDIGGYPPPRIIYREPRVIQRVSVNRPPIYLNVPPATPKTGTSTAARTTPAANGSISCKTAGMTANTFRITRNCIMATAMTVVTIVAGKRMIATTRIAARGAVTKALV